MTVQVFHPTPVDQSATNWAVAARIVGAFAPHAQTAPDMTVALDAGALFNGATLTEVPAQSTTAITAPATNPRIDRVVVDRVSGDVSIVTGIEASSPVAPAIPAGKLPVARVALSTTTTAITDDLITDERVPFAPTAPAADVLCRASLGGTNQTGVASGVYTKVNLSNASINVGAGFDTTNSRFKPTTAGYYAVFGQVCIHLNDGKVVSAALYKNGTLFSNNSGLAGGSWDAFAVCSDIVYLNGTTDYVELYAFHNNGVASSVWGLAHLTYFTAQRIA